MSDQPYSTPTHLRDEDLQPRGWFNASLPYRSAPHHDAVALAGPLDGVLIRFPIGTLGVLIPDSDGVYAVCATCNIARWISIRHVRRTCLPCKHRNPLRQP